MALNPEIKDRLERFTVIAKAIIYDKDRMTQFLQLMNSKEGAITAVKAVMGAIDTKKPIPPEVAPFLGVNAYMLMVDVAREITGRKPNPEIIREVIWMIMNSIKPTGQPQQPQGQPAPAQARPGLIQQPMGA
jgi:hypothetical protein